MAQYQSRTGPIVNDATAVTPDMLQGYAPTERSHASRSFHRSGVVTPPDAVLATDMMLLHARPVAPRPHRPSKGPSFFPFSGTTAAHSPDMFRGVTSDTSRARPPQRSQVAAAPDVPVFSIEMIVGSRPDRFRQMLGPRLPLPVSQLTHVEAPFTADMVDGWTPDRQRYGAPFHQGTLAQTPDVPVFSIEMVIGSKPDSPRILLGTRIPLPLSQTTHVAAPLTADMVDGWSPDRHRYSAPVHAGAQWWTPETLDFSIEMVFVTRPERPRKDLVPKIPSPSGWSVSQTTDVLTLTPDMTLGSAPYANRYTAPLHVGALAQLPEVQIFSIEMVAGSRPDRSRVLLGVRIPLPVAQVTHVEAPVSYEMLRGWLSYHLPGIALQNIAAIIIDPTAVPHLLGAYDATEIISRSPIRTLS